MVPDKKRSLRELADLVAAIGPEDGTPSKILKKNAERLDRRGDKTARRLAREAERRLTLALQDARGDAVFTDLAIARVDAASDGAHLRVLVVPANPKNPPPEKLVRQALARAAGWLRAEVAAAVRRRRVPQLLFDYVATGEAQP